MLHECLASVLERRARAQTSLEHFFRKKQHGSKLDSCVDCEELVQWIKHNTQASSPVGLRREFPWHFPKFRGTGIYLLEFVRNFQKNGKYMQQDAEEFWTQLLQCLRVLPKLPNSDHVKGGNAVEQLFSLSFKEEYKCQENPDEPATTNAASALKLSCNIQIQADTKNIAKDVYTALDQVFRRNFSELLTFLKDIRWTDRQKISYIEQRSKIPKKISNRRFALLLDPSVRPIFLEASGRQQRPQN